MPVPSAKAGLERATPRVGCPASVPAGCKRSAQS